MLESLGNVPTAPDDRSEKSRSPTDGRHTNLPPCRLTFMRIRQRYGLIERLSSPNINTPSRSITPNRSRRLTAAYETPEFEP